jgi:hypothetical protein
MGLGNMSTLCGVPKQQIKVKGGFLHSRMCSVSLAFCLLSQVVDSWHQRIKSASKNFLPRAFKISCCVL